MKFFRPIRFFTLFSFIIACATKNEKPADINETVPVAAVVNAADRNDTFVTGKVITKVLCISNPGHSYALYIPPKSDRDRLPVIYFFDPHGDGALPVARYRALADRYGFILIGSNNSKNGNDWPTAENIWNILSEDSKKRVRVNVNRIYTAGFSGGAKVAGYVALNHPEIKGVLAGGAGLPDATAPGNFRFSFTAIAGEGDMNMTELVAFNAALENTTSRHRIIFFDGKHEWSPENTMGIAIAGLEFDAMHERQIPANNGLVSNYIDAGKKRTMEFLNANNYIKAGMECQLIISLLDGLSGDINWFKEKNELIKKNPVYLKQMQSRQDLLAYEENRKAIYRQQFERGNMDYWMITIRDLQGKAKSSTAEAAMCQRLVAYLSLAFYSISNQLIESHRDKEARFFVDLYKTDDAANPEAWYFSAILNARNNNINAAKEELVNAIAKGFADKNRMLQQPEFRNLPPDFIEQEGKKKQQ